MAMQREKQNLCNQFMELGLIQQKVKFFESCLSEGLMPNGLRGTFNLALDVNDEEFVEEIQNIFKNSTLSVYIFWEMSIIM